MAAEFAEASKVLGECLADGFGTHNGDVGEVFLSAASVEQEIARLMTQYVRIFTLLLAHLVPLIMEVVAIAACRWQAVHTYHACIQSIAGGCTMCLRGWCISIIQCKNSAPLSRVPCRERLEVCRLLQT